MVKKQLYIFLVLLVSALVMSCSPGANNPPDGNDNQPGTEPDRDLMAFSITEEKFLAEKAVLSVLSLENSDEYISNGKFIKDYEDKSLGITIHEGSVVSSDSQAKAIGDQSSFDLLVSGEDGSKIREVKYKGNSDGNNISFSSGDKDYESLPIAFLSGRYMKEIREIIISYCTTGELPQGYTLYKDESFYDDKITWLGWIVFSSPHVDGIRHKVNFQYINGYISFIIFDGWYDSDKDGAVDDPAIKDDDAPLSDEEAIKLAPSMLSFYFYIQCRKTIYPDDESIITKDGWNFETIDMHVPDFFGKEDSIVNGYMKQTGGKIWFDFTIDGHRVEICLENPPNTSPLAMQLHYLYIDGYNYSHLKDIVTESSMEGYYMARPLYAVFEYVAGMPSYGTPSGICTETESGYEFDNFNSGALFCPDITGTFDISGDTFEFDLVIDVVLSASDYSEIINVPIKGSGYFKFGNKKGPQLEFIYFSDTDKMLSDLEIDRYNMIYSLLNTEMKGIKE